MNPATRYFLLFSEPVLTGSNQGELGSTHSLQALHVLQFQMSWAITQFNN